MRGSPRVWKDFPGIIGSKIWLISSWNPRITCFEVGSIGTKYAYFTRYRNQTTKWRWSAKQNIQYPRLTVEGGVLKAIGHKKVFMSRKAAYNELLRIRTVHALESIISDRELDLSFREMVRAADALGVDFNDEYRKFVKQQHQYKNRYPLPFPWDGWENVLRAEVKDPCI